MSCCPPSRPARQDASSTQDAARRACTESFGIDIIRFAGGRSTVGTNAPVIPGDGEGPARSARLNRFGMAAAAVTNGEFEAFVAATGYRTTSEELGWSHVFSGLLDNGRTVPSVSELPWWSAVDGACWKHPEGPGSSVAERMDHPVVHVSWRDAGACARWAGGRLPTEAEWEHAARGNLPDARFPWGDEEPTDTDIRCNIWQGRFPYRNSCADGHYGTAPVYWGEPNTAGLYNMAGNVWEWTADAFRIRSARSDAKNRNATASQHGEKVAKGGSFLCHRSYCYRYRIAARSSMSPDSATSNLGFRLTFD